MICPLCKSENNKVIDSRNRDNRIYRRRKCLDCNIPFTTYEISDDDLRDRLADFKLRGPNNDTRTAL